MSMSPEDELEAMVLDRQEDAEYEKFEDEVLNIYRTYDPRPTLEVARALQRYAETDRFEIEHLMVRLESNEWLTERLLESLIEGVIWRRWGAKRRTRTDTADGGRS